jgi:metal-responsive CopG/Arc/MetJ family transcriptional regulator
MMGRPPHGIGKDALKTVLVSLPIRLISWIDRRAEMLGISRSAVVRDALADYKKRQSEKPKA